MLKIATEERVHVNILRCAVYNLNIILKDDGPVSRWLRNEESLEGFLLILGRKLPMVGDFECQSHIFETLCYIVYNNENKHKWIQSWFTDDEKTRSMFLNWDLEHFAVESRKILNQINRRELNPRTYAFAATAVYLGNVQLGKLNGLEFWIDFNYDSRSISFFCKDFEVEDQDSECWETVVIPSDSVESYSVQKKEDIKSIELRITLNCSCSNLLLSPTPFLESTNLVRMIFWIYVDISSHLKLIFGDPVILANNHAVNSQGSQRTRKVSHSVDAFEIVDQDIQAEDYCEKKERRISDSAELVPLSDDSGNFHMKNTVTKSHDFSQKRKVSYSSIFLKESDSERNFQMSGKKKHPRFKFGRNNSTENYSKNNGKLTNAEDERDTNRHHHKESSSQIFRSERKSSNAFCDISCRSDDSDILIIDTDDAEERRSEEISESLLKEKHEVAHGKYSEEPRSILEGFIENKNMNINEEVSRLKFQKIVQDVEIEETVSNGFKKPSQPIKAETGLSFKDSDIKINSYESVKLSQKDKKPISPDGSQSSQRRTKKVDGSTKVSQETSDKNDKNKLTENTFPEKGQIKDQEVKLSREDTSENELHLSDKHATVSEPRKKRLKKNSDEVGNRKSSTNRLSRRKPNDKEKEVISDETPPKKRRKAAIKAMEKNKTMLEQKESGTTDGFSEKSCNINHSNDEIEIFCTPPTKPVKKRRLKSVFLTDTETGSSNVSWFGGKNTCLFETPQKRYSKRMKSKQPPMIQNPKKKTYKTREGNSKMKQNSHFSMNGFEMKSKSGLSDLENYELVVEKKSDPKKSSNLSHKHFSFENVSKAINTAMEGMLNKPYFDDKLDKESNSSNVESQMYDSIQRFDYDVDLHTDEVKVKEDLITKESDLTNIDRKGFKSNVANEQNMVQMTPKPPSSKERYSRTGKPLFQDSSSNPEVHQRSVSINLPLSNSVRKRKSTSPEKKRKTDNLSALKEKTKRSRNDSNLQSFISDSITHSDAIDLHPTCLSPKVGILTEQSLSSLVSENDEAAGKEFHMQRFLEELSGESNSLNHLEYADKLDETGASKSNKTNKSNVSASSGDLLEHSISEKHLTDEIKVAELSSAKKKHFTSFEESHERSKASSKKSHQKFSLLDNHSDSGLQEEGFERYMKKDNHQKISKINGKKPSKQHSVLHILGVATDTMTHRLLKTLQKHFYNFNVKITASREKMLATANALISQENKWNHKDLKNIAKAYKMNRIQAEKSLNQIMLVGEEYFEAEKKLDHKLKRLHKKALEKYAAKIKLAGRYAINALEDRAAAKTEVLLKSILKKIEYL
ncbi:unnamed protein product [Larinioides sclopetarius]|uniref:Synaptonemal complex protein 2 Spt16M-like domain-containing protein n=1 Tax=Larinioides sclopetarius TaxID=280406 RepID=A0AAV1YVW3_9ARAC